MLLRCLYHLYKNISGNGTIIISSNDNRYNKVDENKFFNVIRDIFKDRYEIVVIEGGQYEDSGQSNAVNYCLDNGIDNLYILHSDCFVNGDFISTVESIKDEYTTFVGKIWDQQHGYYRWYTGENYLYYVNVINMLSHLNIMDTKTWSGKRISDSVKVDSGLGDISYYLSHNPRYMKLRSFYDMCEHKGDVKKTHHITVDYYSIFNDLNSYNDCLTWYINKYNSPNFMNDLCFRQYNFLFYKVKQYRNNEEFSPIYSTQWTVDMPLLFNTPFQNELFDKK
jgi:hypothetical protein